MMKPAIVLPIYPKGDAMAQTDADILQLFQELSGIQEIPRLSLGDVRANPDVIRYVMLEVRGTGIPYEVTWDTKDELGVFRRVLRDGKRGPRLVARVTLNAEVGHVVNLQDIDKKAKAPSYTPHGKLVSAISSPRLIPLKELWRLLGYFSHRSS